MAKSAPSKPADTSGLKSRAAGRSRAPLPEPRHASHSHRRLWTLVTLALIVALLAAVRVRVLDFPLERDEGEYAYAGQLMLQGVPPYQLAYNMKLPGIYAAYALILFVCGPSPAGVHLGLLAVNIACVLLVFALARRLYGASAGLVAAASYALLSTSPSVLGMAAHATHFIVLPALGGVLLLLEADERPALWRTFAGGLLLGLAFLMKQHGVVFVLFGLAFVLSRPLRGRSVSRTDLLRRLGLLMAGAVLPIALTGAILMMLGVFDAFWFWTFSYARAYASEIPLTDAWRQFALQFPRVVDATTRPLWLLAGAGLVAVWRWKERRAAGRFLSALLVISFLGVTPGFYFREHYFIVLLPAVAVLIGAAIAATAHGLSTRRVAPALANGLAALLFGVPLALSLVAHRAAFLELSPEALSRAIYGRNPFPEALPVARYISAHSAPTDRIAVLGSEPEIYFYSGRRSATGYIYTYALMEPQPYARRMQEEMIREIESARPEYVVFVDQTMSWLVRQDSERLVFSWMKGYLEAGHTLVGVVDIPQAGESVYRWDADVADHTPGPSAAIFIFRRRPGA